MVRHYHLVRTQHVLIATVRDKQGQPLPNRRVEWVIADGGVGDIIQVDESGFRASRGYKLTNKFAVSHTNNGPHVLDQGTPDPSDDIHLTAGQTWCVITSPIEGTTHVIAFAPGIYDSTKHKVFAVKHWYDVAYEFPPEAANRVAAPHEFVTRITRHSDGAPLAGFEVTYRIVSGPAAVLQPGGKEVVTVRSDANGLATVTLEQTEQVAGANQLEIDVVRPTTEAGLPHAQIATGRTSKTWLMPAIDITKKAPSKALLGEAFLYEIWVCNPSQVYADNVVVRDDLPDGITYVNSTPAATVSGQQLAWSVGRLPAGGKKAFRVTVKPTVTGPVTNRVSVHAELGLSDEAESKTLIIAAKLSVTKTAPEEALICDPIPYTILVSNTGNAPATNVRLHDVLPEGLTVHEGRGKLVSDLGTLEPGESKQVRFDARAARTGTFENTVTVAADGGLMARDSATTAVRKPILVVTKTGPATTRNNRPVKYEITVTNKGDAAADDTVVVDVVPAGAMFAEATEDGEFAGGKVTWQLGKLDIGETRIVSVTFKAVEIGTLHNVTTVTAVCAEASAEASTVVEGVPSVGLKCIDLADSIEVGGEVTYRITVINQGTAANTNIVIACTLPGEEAFVSAQGPTKVSAADKKVTFASLASLAPGRTATFTVVAKGIKAGDARFLVTLTSDQLQTPVQETESTRFYE
ncbi:MAG TPA: DUF11 domain-containing protein [Phycisphaerae bacterium]|nr:DUF11 domain-containing protein [Phycisphaerae bacterium]